MIEMIKDGTTIGAHPTKVEWLESNGWTRKEYKQVDKKPVKKQAVSKTKDNPKED